MKHRRLPLKLPPAQWLRTQSPEANIGNPVVAMDVDGDTLTYTLGGTDEDSFDI